MKIITHEGRGHRNDFLACCWLLYDLRDSDPVIDRRQPTTEDLEDPQVVVVDVGGRFEPEKNNFDHHQDKASLDSPLAMVIQRSSPLYVEALRAIPWLSAADAQDARGLRAAAWELGVPPKTYVQMISPLETVAVDVFSALSYIHQGSPLWWMMLKTGEQIHREVESHVVLTEQIDRLAEENPPVEIEGLRVWWLDTDEELTRRVSSFHSCRHKFNQKVDDLRVDVSVTPYSRNRWSIFRFGKAFSKFDGFRAAKFSDVEYASDSGHLIVTCPDLPKSRIEEIVDACRK